MSQLELLKRIVRLLDETGIEYMITGSVASSMQGEPRSTHDIDIVTAIEKSQASKLTELIMDDKYYMDSESVIKAIDNQKMFNLIDMETGDKIDFWILTDSAFDKSRFSRRIDEEIEGIKVAVSSPEDTILSKLRWAKMTGGSEKQFTDALRIYEVQQEKLDKNYMEQWVKKLRVGELYKRLKKEAQL